tara:strand:+ start:3452 stop:4096 length:645 start_codon:yes stop_codon:yes gene_type:complete
MNKITTTDIENFEFFLLTTMILMPVSKKLTEIFIENIIIKRKINQYTNWNIFMIIMNYVNTNIYLNKNVLIDKFIALNSLQIFMFFHGFILYDKRILFEELQGVEPIFKKLLIFNNISKRTILNCEYIIFNIILHILPVYYYRDSLINYNLQNEDFTIYMYTICFKFMWVLNIIGSFNVTSIYVPKLNICNIKIINLIFAIDVLSDKILKLCLK